MTRPLDVLLHHMKASAASANVWEAGFARSILQQSRRRSWRPSEKQIAIMDRLVSEAMCEDAFAVIED